MNQLSQDHRIVDAVRIPPDWLKKPPSGHQLLLRETDNEFVNTLAFYMCQNPTALVAPWFCVLICKQGTYPAQRF